MTTNSQDRLRIPPQGNDYTRFETKTGLHVATGYTRVVIGERGGREELLLRGTGLVMIRVTKDGTRRWVPSKDVTEVTDKD